MDGNTIVFLYDTLKDYIDRYGYKSYNKQNINISGEYEAKKIYLNKEYEKKDRVMLSNTAIELVYKYFLRLDNDSKESLELFINNYNIVDYYYEFIEKLKSLISEGIVSEDILYEYGKNLAKESNNPNEIKLGLTLLRFSNKEDVIDIYRIFSIHNNYMFFSLEGMKEYPMSNSFTFKVCKISRGYGKLIAISKLEMLSDEIRFWLVENGSENNIIEEELANMIFENLDIYWYLYNGKINLKKFNVLSNVIGRLYSGNIYFKENYNYDLAYDYVNMFKKYGKKFRHLYALVGILVSIGEHNKNSLLKGRNSYKEAIKETKNILKDIEIIFSDPNWINIIKNELLKGGKDIDKIIEVAFLLKEKLTFNDLYEILKRDKFNTIIYRYILANSNKSSKRQLVSFTEDNLKNESFKFYEKESNKSKVEQCVYILLKEMKNLTKEFLSFNIEALLIKNENIKREALKNLKENVQSLKNENLQRIRCIANEEVDIEFARKLTRFTENNINKIDSKKIDISDIRVQEHAKDIYLITLKVVGTNYLDISRAKRSMLLGDFVFLKEEEKNPFDNNAIMVISSNGYQIGYVPKKDNLILKNLLSSGKRLYGILEEIDEYYENIIMSVYISYRDIEEEINNILKMVLSKSTDVIN
ncbi:HIRAN domain-containing protein [Clostridium septicum]|nr:HIRAN domain-containing protein [Clostridium septicum]MDU1312976.1 HIRAN domain-containing protein [Clostridium septicum]UEC22103.1 HIRAN domain-containing protein [Clostridium septicum]USR99866.1 HIRAN domain-containing protein [Clostridium septicum]WLF68386.1 HIRAN domain-containing protein [Clostridium septicum]